MKYTSRGVTRRTLAVVAMLVLGFSTAMIGIVGAASTASAADHNGGKGANQSGPFDPHDVGGGVKQGNGKAPANGTVGKADGKNPPGQLKNNKNRGYECAGNKGVGNNGGNPAHSGCATTTPPPGPNGGAKCPPGNSKAGTPIPEGANPNTFCAVVAGISSELPEPGVNAGDKGAPGSVAGTEAQVLGVEAHAPAMAPTAVDAGALAETADESGRTAFVTLLVLGGALILCGLVLGFGPAPARGKHSL